VDLRHQAQPGPGGGPGPALLSAAGYRSGASEPAGLQALAWAYGGLPCLLKLAAAALLWRAERLHSSWRHT
jgi:hypothetical protein